MNVEVFLTTDTEASAASIVRRHAKPDKHPRTNPGIGSEKRFPVVARALSGCLGAGKVFLGVRGDDRHAERIVKEVEEL